MILSEVIAKLEALKAEYGDLEAVKVITYEEGPDREEDIDLSYTPLTLINEDEEHYLRLTRVTEVPEVIPDGHRLVIGIMEEYNCRF